MFDEPVEITAQDGRRTTARCAFFTDGTGDPISESVMDTEREDVTFVFAERDWPFAAGLKRGAKIRRCRAGTEYAVSEARLDNCLGWCVRARES